MKHIFFEGKKAKKKGGEVDSANASGTQALTLHENGNKEVGGKEKLAKMGFKAPLVLCHKKKGGVESANASFSGGRRHWQKK